jgi:NADH-quinone oxidoreductase subunit N
VPFHFWCPDVFEGAAAEVAGFLSVASKGAALALLGRLALGLAGPVDEPRWAVVAPYLMPALAVFAVLTTTFGNLAAYGQTNLKRLLAYSTIAHAGYMMMGFVPLNTEGAGAVLFYLVTYLFMNLGAFAIVAFLRNQLEREGRHDSEDLSAYRGLIQRSPLLAVALAICLLSLLGLPPLAGFTAKFQIFSVLYQAGQEQASQGHTALSTTLYSVLVIGGLNTVLSLFYYIKVLKVMILDKPLEEVESRPVVPLKPLPWQVTLYAVVVAGAVLALGVGWGPLDDASRVRGVENFPRPAAVQTAQAGTNR